MSSLTENVIRIGLAIILHPERNEVLIARRKKGTHLANFWEFPGGKVEAGETAADCAVRETFEETGLKVVSKEEWAPTVFAYPDRTVALCPVECRFFSGEARAIGSDEVAWVSAADLDSYAFPPANEPILVKLKARLTGNRE